MSLRSGRLNLVDVVSYLIADVERGMTVNDGLLDAIVGNRTAACVLLYLQRRGEGYSLAVAREHSLPHSQVRKQLMRLESGGVLTSRLLGRTRVFVWNPNFPLHQELRELVQAALDRTRNGRVESSAACLTS
jgi:hypothetical protein